MSEILASPEQNTNTYQVSDITNLMITSFRFARGNVTIQRGFLSFIADNYSNRFGDSAIFDAALEPTQQVGRDIYLRHAASTPAEDQMDSYKQQADNEVKKFMGDFRTFVEDGSMADHYVFLSDMVPKLIYREHLLLESFQVNPERKRGPITAFSSNLVTYGLLGKATKHENFNRTGREEFDAAFEAIAKLLLDEPDRVLNPDAPETTKGANHLADIIRAHIASHPDDEPALSEVLAGTALAATLQEKVDPSNVPLAITAA
jgi:hypothetical protein